MYRCDLINLSTVKVIGDEHDVQQLAKIVLDQLFARFKTRLNPYEPETIKRCFRQEIDIFRLQITVLFTNNRELYHQAEEDERKRLASDSYQHLVHYLWFARHTKNARVWVAFDNVDQGSESYQSFVYSFAQRLSTDSRCLTLITLREDTYVHARDSGFLDVRSDTVLRINAPELSQVLAKRRKYVSYLIDNNRLPSNLKHFIAEFQALHWHLNHLFLQTCGDARLMVTSLSLSNIRFSLSMIRAYYLSYHSSLHADFASPSGDHEQEPFVFSGEMIRFVQAAMLGNWTYSESTSLIFNVFAIEQRQRPTHFLCLRLLAYLEIGRSEQTKNLTRLRDLINDFVSIGFVRTQIDSAVKRMLQHRRIVSPTYPIGYIKERSIELPDTLDENMRVLLTAKGYYYLAYLPSNSYYQMRVAEDTAWMDEERALEYTSCLEDSAKSQALFGAEDALLATKGRDLFLTYLKNCWSDELRSLGLPQDPRHWSYRINEMVEGYVFGQDKVLRTTNNQPNRRQPASPIGKADLVTSSAVAGQAEESTTASVAGPYSTSGR